METPSSGRFSSWQVLCGDVDDANWQFLESGPYLEQLGALGRADPQHMSVIISNYVNSPSNVSLRRSSTLSVGSRSVVHLSAPSKAASPHRKHLRRCSLSSLPGCRLTQFRRLGLCQIHWPSVSARPLRTMAKRYHCMDGSLHSGCTMRTLANVHTRISQARRTQSPMRRTWTKLVKRP